MALSLTSGKNKDCKDSVGGISEVYIFSYTKHPKSQIIVDDLTLTSFPETNIYKFEFNNEPNFTNDSSEDEGGKFYNESLNLEFVGIYVWDGFERFLKKDLRIIIKDRNNKYRLLGAYNGLIVDRIQRTTGDAKNTFRGYRITFEGKELNPSLFIDDLEDTGFNIVENIFLLSEDGKYILTENNELIIA